MWENCEKIPDRDGYRLLTTTSNRLEISATRSHGVWKSSLLYRERSDYSCTAAHNQEVSTMAADRTSPALAAQGPSIKCWRRRWPAAIWEQSWLLYACRCKWRCCLKRRRRHRRQACERKAEHLSSLALNCAAQSLQKPLPLSVKIDMSSMLTPPQWCASSCWFSRNGRITGPVLPLFP